MAGAARRSERLFLAALPDATAARRIDRLARQLCEEHGLSGAPLGSARYHVTLLFLGDQVPAEAQRVADAVGARMAAVARPPFGVVLDHVASFRRRGGKAPLVLLGSDGVDGLIDLHEALLAALAGPDFAPPTTPFTPHLTLLYDAKRVAEQRIDPIDWTVREFALVHSAIGAGVHTVLRRWTLGGG